MPGKKSKPRAKQAEGARRLSAFHNCFAYALVLCDSRGRITHFSPEAENLAGLKSRQALGQPVSLLSPALGKIVSRVAAGGRSITGRTIDLATAGIARATVCVRAVPLPGAKGKSRGVVVTLDHLHQLEQNLRRLDRLANIGTLSASVAHEIKNALVAVKTFVDLLLEKHRDAELAAVVGREMKRIDALVSQMLRMASPAKPNFAPVSVHEVLNHSLQLVQHQVDEKLIQLHCSFQATPHLTHGNSYQLEQAFVNVLLNAIEAMSPNGELAVITTTLPGTDKTPARICITFRDSGVGIPPENMGRLFDTFFTTKRNGTGLGLAITRRVVHEHGGDITAESQPNRGATFRIALPTAPGQEAPA